MYSPRIFKPNHKFLFVVFVSVFCLSARSYGQYTEITALGGITIKESFFTSDGFDVTIHDGATYGGGIGFYPNPHYDITLMYTRQSTKIDFYDYYYSRQENNVSASVNNIFLSFNRNQVLNENGTSVFGGIGLGTAGLVPEGYGDRWKFAYDLHLGAKIFPNPRIGIRLQAGINFPVQYFGVAFTAGTGGSGAGVSASSTITQLNFLAGIIFRIEKK